MSSAGLLLAWCPGQNAPCDPCKKPPPPKPQPGYPPWNTLRYDGVLDIIFLYQATAHGQVVTPPGGNLWGGHTVTFGPHAAPDPGYWMQPPFIVKDTTYLYWTSSTATIGYTSVQFPTVQMADSSAASVQQTDQATQWAAYNYLIAH